MRIIAETLPRARFAHTCAICQQLIAAGEQHILIVYCDLDTLDPRHAIRRLRYHLHCPRAASPLPTEPPPAPEEPPKAGRVHQAAQFPDVPSPQSPTSQSPTSRPQRIQPPRPFSPPKPRGHR